MQIVDDSIQSFKSRSLRADSAGFPIFLVLYYFVSETIPAVGLMILLWKSMTYKEEAS